METHSREHLALFSAIKLTKILVGFPCRLDPLVPQDAGYRTECWEVHSNTIWSPASRVPPSAHHTQVGPGSTSPIAIIYLMALFGMLRKRKSPKSLSDLMER